MLPCRTMYSLHMTVKSLTTLPSCLAGALIMSAKPLLSFLWTCTEKGARQGTCYAVVLNHYLACVQSFAFVAVHLSEKNTADACASCPW